METKKMEERARIKLNNMIIDANDIASSVHSVMCDGGLLQIDTDAGTLIRCDIPAGNNHGGANQLMWADDDSTYPANMLCSDIADTDEGDYYYAYGNFNCPINYNSRAACERIIDAEADIIDALSDYIVD